ncbi:nicotinate-nucleotide diphosphorylase [Lacunimicrobium album]
MTSQLTWSDVELSDARWLIDRALQEDLHGQPDPTTTSLIAPETMAKVTIGSRAHGRLAGLPVVKLVLDALNADADMTVFKHDGDVITPGDVIVSLRGPLGLLLVAERTILNFLIHLSGIATVTSQYVELVKGTKAVLLDTRKTLPAYRTLAKYAVRCGGGTNHRMGLYDGILIKDNHLAGWRQQNPDGTLADAIHEARERQPGMKIEVEVDTLIQLADVLQARPEIVLLDNMSLDELRQAITMRDQFAPGLLLEASGGVNLKTVQSIAQTGVDRISVGALTHSAPALDLGFDWSI